MINSIHIKNFKSHADTFMEMSNVNILTGINGIGKSSIIQAFLLLRQSHRKNLLNRGLDLNGELCSIGSVEDCIYQDATSDNVDFTVQLNENTLTWSFKSQLTSLDDTFIRLDDTTQAPTIDANNIIFNDNFQYISAFRNGPVNDYIKDTSSVELLNQISRKEGRCELIAHFLYHFRDNIVNKALIKNTDLDASLSTQVEAWMREISPNINIHVKPNDTSFKINYSYKFQTQLYLSN